MRWLVALCIVMSGVCEARSYTIDDMLRLESYGQVTIARQAGLVLVERRGAYDTATDYAYGYLTRRLLSRIEVADVTLPKRLRPLFDQPAGAGYWMGGLSPDGMRLTVFRLKDRRLSLGVVDLPSRKVTWLSGTPDLPIMSPAPIWVDRTHLVAVMIDDGSLPFVLSLGNATRIALGMSWSRQANGRDASATLASTRQVSVIPSQRSLVEIDVRTGAVRVLWRGNIDDVAASADGRTLAVVATSGLRPPPPSPIDTSFIGRMHQIFLVDRIGGSSTAVGGDYLPGFLRWAPDRSALLAFRAGASFAEGHFIEITAGGRSRVLAPALQPFVTSEQSGTNVRAGWLGTMIVAAMQRDGRRTWMRIDGTARALAVPPTAELAGSDIHGLWFLDRGSLFHLDRHGHRGTVERNVVRTGVEQLDPFSVGYRHAVDPDGPPAAIIGRGDDVEVVSLPGRERIDAALGSVVLDVRGNAAVTLETDDHGVAMLRLRRSGASTVLDAINPHLASIRLAEPVPLRRSPGAASAIDWLFLPRRAGKVPMVVIPYPGAVFGSRPPAVADLSAWSVPTNVNILLAHGYAVLLPSIPAAPAEAPSALLVDAVDAAADAAIATGRIDGARIGVLGHSFGAYAAMTIATRSTRYRAVIASSGPYDLVSAHGMMVGADRIHLSRGIPFENGAGWVEAGQARMLATPGEAPAAYAAQSPIFDAARVRVPVMLVHGDMDTVAIEQAEHMFMELARYDADATLVRYWGEGHVLDSPANIRDYWHRVLTFLDGHLTVMSSRPSSTPRNSPALPSLDTRG